MRGRGLRTRGLLALVVPAAAVGLVGLAVAVPESPPATAAGSAPTAATATSTVVAFAGDIADGGPGTPAFAASQATAHRVQAMSPRFVLTGGDNAYPTGSATDFTTKYAPTWGAFKDITRPSPGNHEYETPGAAGYYGYFFGGTQAGHTYYAFHVGSGWRAYSLNCEIACGRGSAQLAWLRRDLAGHPGRHYLVYLHRPRFTSGPHAPLTTVSAIWRTVQAAGGDLVLAGHNHHYERFAKLDASGSPSPSGLVQMVAGAGGAELYGYPRTSPHSLARNNRDYAVLRLTLRQASYSWRYVGSGMCGNGSAPYACPARDGLVLDSGTAATNNPAP